MIIQKLHKNARVLDIYGSVSVHLGELVQIPSLTSNKPETFG